MPGDDSARVELIAVLERLTGAATSAQARVSVEFDRSQRAEQADAGLPRSRRGVGVAHQLGLARHVSPWQAKVLFGLAVTLDRELPCTAEALRYGRTSLWRAMIIARGTAALSAEDRARIDREICGDPARVESMGDKELAGRVAALAAQLDPGSVAARRRKAEQDRRVGLRPAPDTMSHLSGLLPVADGVAVFASLSEAADTARSRGDDRTRGQVMADTLVERIIGRATSRGGEDEPATDHPSKGFDPDAEPEKASRAAGYAADHAARLAKITWAGCDTATATTTTTDTTTTDTATTDTVTTPAAVADNGPRTAHTDVGVVINLVMTDQQLFAGVDGAAWLDGYGPVDAEAARGLARSDRVWLRRCFSDPDTGTLVATESRSRFFPPGLKHLIRLRDQTCRTPWCDAPIRQADHVVDHNADGPTSLANGQGLCEACNHAKQAPRWRQYTPDRLAELGAAADQADQQRWNQLPTGLPPLGRNETVIVTPTGHTYLTRPPRHDHVPRQPTKIQIDPGTTPSPPLSPGQVQLEITFAAA